jgi:predicted solute-binding protein
MYFRYISLSFVYANNTNLKDEMKYNCNIDKIFYTKRIKKKFYSNTMNDSRSNK